MRTYSQKQRRFSPKEADLFPKSSGGFPKKKQTFSPKAAEVFTKSSGGFHQKQRTFSEGNGIETQKK